MRVFCDHGPHYKVIAALAKLDPGLYDHSVSFATDDGRFIGGVAYQGHTGASIRVHMAIALPAQVTRGMYALCFHYPFVQLGVRKVIAGVPSYNAKSLALTRRLGFKEETTIAGVYEQGDLVVFGMTRDECRWLRYSPGDQRRAA